MNTRSRFAASLVTLALLTGSTGCLYRFAGPPPDASVDELLEWMDGSFSSLAQSEALPEDYLDIRLVMEPIWTGREDGPWLYVEQAAASALDRPYRQRVYHLVPEDGGVRSDVYELPGDPQRFAGGFEDTGVFEEIEPEDLQLRAGCSIRLVRDLEVYRGSTLGQACATDWGDAAYATSEVTIAPDSLTSWDRGFSEDGKQAWGAVAGPYVFDRVP